MRLTALLTAMILPLLGLPALAQSSFSPAITVNDSVITAYELDQRTKLLTLFRTPGDASALARTQLIEERLKQEELDRRGAVIAPEALASEVEAFAARADLSAEQFGQVLAQSGIAPATLEQFVKIGVTWRDYIRQRYSSQAQISDVDIARAISQQGTGNESLEVLLTEIIIAAPPPRAAEANAIAEQITQVTTQAAFEAAARQYSALPSRSNGGKLNWLPLTNYPPALQGLISGLSIGEVTAPIQIPNGIALFQMRGIREVRQDAAQASQIDYATFAIAGDAQAAQGIAQRVDTCDDLYGVAKGLPAEALVRQTVAPAQIPKDVALELAKLDRNETSVGLARGNGTLLVMMCGRTFGDGSTDPDALRASLQSQRLEGFANALISDLRAAATIRP